MLLPNSLVANLDSTGIQALWATRPAAGQANLRNGLIQRKGKRFSMSIVSGSSEPLDFSADGTSPRSVAQSQQYRLTNTNRSEATTSQPQEQYWSQTMQSTHERRWDKTGDTQISKEAWQQWGSLIGGGALAVIGLTRRSAAGWALAATGGALAYAGWRSSNGNQQSQRRPELGSKILVNAAAEEAFRQWRDVEQAPRYMNFIESVEKIDDRRSKWTASGPMGVKVQWTSEITDERPGEYIAWRSLPGSDLNVQGRVEFSKAPAERGTIVASTMRYELANRALRAAASGFVGRQASFLIRQDMRRFKALLETGEIPTTHGQTHGQRSSMDKAAKALNPNRPQRRQAQTTGNVEAFRRVS
jgi:uncharacterized membrane protein